MIRALADNPMYTGTPSQALPADIRSEIYRNAGMANIYGVNIVELVEFGKGRKYNTLFNDLAFTAGTDNLEALQTDADAAAGNQAWDADVHQIVVGIDNSRGAFIRPVSRGHDYGGSGTFTALPDEQFNAYGNRVEKTGFYGFLEEGRICIDARAIMGLIL